VLDRHRRLPGDRAEPHQLGVGTEPAARPVHRVQVGFEQPAAPGQLGRVGDQQPDLGAQGQPVGGGGGPWLPDARAWRAHHEPPEVTWAEPELDDGDELLVPDDELLVPDDELLVPDDDPVVLEPPEAEWADDDPDVDLTEVPDALAAVCVELGRVRASPPATARPL